jgi:hypothetical protein
METSRLTTLYERITSYVLEKRRVKVKIGYEEEKNAEW